jgi:hypothetical protein
MLVVFAFVHPEQRKQEKQTILAQIKHLDPLGVLFFVPAMVCLILALQWGGTTNSWSAPRVIGLLVAFAVLFVAFVAVQVMMPDTAMAPTRVILDRSIAGSLSFMFLVSGGLMSVIYYLTVWFQAIKDDSALRAGLSTLPVTLAFILTGIVTAIATQKIRYYVPPLLLTPMLSSVGAGMLSTLRATSGHSEWMGYQALFGLGVGVGFQTSMLPVQYVLPRADVPIGLALTFFMQQIGSSVFLAVSQNVFSTNLISSLSSLTGLDAQEIVDTGATDLRHIVPQDKLSAVIGAYNHALTRVFLLAAILSACTVIGALLVKWVKIPAKENNQTSAKSSNDNKSEENTEEVKV